MERGYWYNAFAPNGWTDWFCGACKDKVENTDVHVTLSWNYCPYCGDKKVEDKRTRIKALPEEEFPKETREYYEWLHEAYSKRKKR